MSFYAYFIIYCKTICNITNFKSRKAANSEHVPCYMRSLLEVPCTQSRDSTAPNIRATHGGSRTLFIYRASISINLTASRSALAPYIVRFAHHMELQAYTDTQTHTQCPYREGVEIRPEKSGLSMIWIWNILTYILFRRWLKKKAS